MTLQLWCKVLKSLLQLKGFCWGDILISWWPVMHQAWRGYSSVLLCHPLNSFLAQNRLSLHSLGLGAAQVSGSSLEILVCLEVAESCLKMQNQRKKKKEPDPKRHWSLCSYWEFCRGCSVNNSGSPYHHCRLMELLGYNLCRSNLEFLLLKG